MTSEDRRRKLTPRFHVGQAVVAPAFVDCFGEHHAEVSGLTVEEVRKIEWEHAPHVRVKAVSVDGFGYVEACQDHFSAVS